jgi:hypothetical protein
LSIYSTFSIFTALIQNLSETKQRSMPRVTITLDRGDAHYACNAISKAINEVMLHPSPADTVLQPGEEFIWGGVSFRIEAADPAEAGETVESLTTKYAEAAFYNQKAPVYVYLQHFKEFADKITSLLLGKERVLDQPARVGATTFGVGVAVSTVINAATRFYVEKGREDPALVSAQEDAILLGAGYVLIRPDGTMERIDPKAVQLHLQPAADETCPDCSRRKAHNADDAAAGLCPKWWAVFDADADRDCERHAFSAREGGADRCPICSEVLTEEDVCATDIEMGICHAECLEGSPTVDLNTGEPIPEGEVDTYRYGEEKELPRKWTNRWYGSPPNRGDTILEVGKHGMGYGKEIAYVGDQCHDAVAKIISAHNAAIAGLIVDEIRREGHEDHTYARFQKLYERARAAHAESHETAELIRDLRNAMRDAANWRSEAAIALRLEQQTRKERDAVIDRARAALGIK